MTHENKAQRTNHSVIVVGVDFSEASADALKEAVALAQSASYAELHVVHVITIPSPGPSLGTAMRPEVAYLDGINDSGKILEEWVAPLRAGRERRRRRLDRHRHDRKARSCSFASRFGCRKPGPPRALRSVGPPAARRSCVGAHRASVRRLSRGSTGHGSSDAVVRATFGAPSPGAHLSRNTGVLRHGLADVSLVGDWLELAG